MADAKQDAPEPAAWLVRDHNGAPLLVTCDASLAAKAAEAGVLPVAPLYTAPALRELLTRVEWPVLLMWDRVHDVQLYGCAVCGNSALQGHAEECALARALTPDAEPRP